MKPSEKLIPFVQPIFIPDVNHYGINERSIVSFAEYITKYPYNVKCYFIGWAATQQHWDSIVKVIKDNIPAHMLYKIVKKEDNLGKGHVVNEALDDIKDEDFEYFLTCDSDIIFLPSEPHMFERLLNVAKKMNSLHDKKIGFLANEQKGCSAHYYAALNDKYIVDGRDGAKEELIYCKVQPGHIAGGSIFVSKEAWFQIGGYRAVAVYGGDDGCLLKDFRKNSYNCYLAKSISIFHPPNTDQEYNQWKSRTCKKDVGKNTFEELKNKANKFWNNRYNNKE